LTDLKEILQDSSIERDLRVQLAGCYRIFNMLGWTELIYNHISVRIPGAESSFLINPFGLHYSEVTASNLVKIDLQGRILAPSDYPVNPAGFMLHAALHSGIPGAHCVMHIHTTAGSAVACSQAGLLHDNFYAAQLIGRVGYHDFEGVTVHAEEGPRLVRSIGDAQAVILRSHGLLSWGPTIPNAFIYLWSLQRACEIQLAGAALGQTLAISPEIQMKTRADALQFDPAHPSSNFVFDALLRQAARIDPGFRD
jgi:ribulose-5-phosphate 4-epimerase/fuculose-1-phosphate aldolase